MVLKRDSFPSDPSVELVHLMRAWTPVFEAAADMPLKSTQTTLELLRFSIEIERLLLARAWKRADGEVKRLAEFVASSSGRAT
jgi:hypothetical protein